MKTQPTPETDAFASRMRTHQEWINHSANLETERDALRSRLASVEKSMIEEYARIKPALSDATKLLDDIMLGQVNPQDESENWLRAYAPQHLFPNKQ